MITLENEFYYEMKNFNLVVKGELTGDYQVLEEGFGHMIVRCNEEGAHFIIKKQ